MLFNTYKRFRTVAFGAATLFFFAPASQAFQVVPLSLTIQQAIERALEHNPTIQMDRERLNEADQAYHLAIAKLLPNLNGTGSAFKEKAAVNGISVPFGGESYNQYTLQLKLDQPIYEGGALLSAMHAAQTEREVRQKELEVAERDLTVQVLQAFYQVLVNQQTLNILNVTLNEEKQTEQLVEHYHRIGRAHLVDLLQIKTQVALLYPQISTAENQIKAYASQLMSLLHDSQAQSVDLQGDIPYVDPASVTKLLASRTELPELTRSKLAIDEFKDTTDVTLAIYNPSFDFQALYGKTANTQSDLLNDFSNTWSVGFVLSVPIFAGLASIHERRVLASQEHQLELTQAALVDTLSYNQVQTERNLDVAGAVLKSSKEAADYGAASLKEAQKEFKLGTMSYIQLNTSQQNFQTSHTNFIQAKYGYIEAVAKYFVSAGIPIRLMMPLLNGTPAATAEGLESQ